MLQLVWFSVASSHSRCQPRDAINYHRSAPACCWVIGSCRRGSSSSCCGSCRGGMGIISSAKCSVVHSEGSSGVREQTAKFSSVDVIKPAICCGAVGGSLKFASIQIRRWIDHPPGNIMAGGPGVARIHSCRAHPLSIQELGSRVPLGSHLLFSAHVVSQYERQGCAGITVRSSFVFLLNAVHLQQNSAPLIVPSCPRPETPKSNL